MRAQVIVADPPWHFSDGLREMRDGVERSAQSQYKTMSTAEIKALDVQSIADPKGCLLALWVPGSMLQWGLDVERAWGFDHKQVYVWVKTKRNAIEDAVVKGHLDDCTSVGMGRYFRQCHEVVLIGTMGTPTPKPVDKSQRSVSFARNEGHSIKPNKLQASLVKMFPDVQRIELFARRNIDRWLCVGDALTGQDVRDSIREIASW